eukprot:gene6408-7434_t
MTTSLDRQLSKIRERSHHVDVSKQRDSLLFGAKEAALIDTEAVYALGQEGLTELIRLDVRFKQFETTLFSETSKRYNRMMVTAEENITTDRDIAAFLRLVSNVFLLNHAQKALEWLVRRFRINEFNIDALLMAVMPYHQSNTFAKSDKKWSFLETAKKNKLTISRDYFVKVIKKQSFFTDLLCDTITEYERTETLSKTMISFFTALLVDFVTASNFINDRFNRSILPCLNFSLKSKNIDLQLGAYMVLGNMASKSQFTENVIELLVQSTLKNCRGSITASFTFLLVLFQRQQFKSLSNQSLELFVSIPALCEILLDMHSQNKSLDRLIQLTLNYLCETFETSADSFELLQFYITEMPMSAGQMRHVAQQILKSHLATCAAGQEDTNIDTKVAVMRLIDADDVQTCLESSDGDEALIAAFQQRIFSQKVLSKNAQTQIFLQLQSPQVFQRRAGLDELAALLAANTKLDARTLGLSLAACLTDSDDTVALKAWSLPQLSTIVPVDAILSALAECLASTSSSASKKSIITAALADIDASSSSSASLALLPFLFLTTTTTTDSSLQQFIVKKISSLPSLPLFTSLSSESNDVELIVQSAISRFLTNHLVMVKFLAQFWSVPSYTAFAQTSAIALCRLFISSRAFEKHALTSELLVPFIAPLISQHRSVRQGASECISLIADAVEAQVTNATATQDTIALYSTTIPKLNTTNYAMLTRLMAGYTNEFTMDPSFLGSFVGTIISAVEPEDTRNVIGSFLVTGGLATESVETRAALMASLGETHDSYFLDTCTEYFTSLLTSVTNSTITRLETRVLDALLAQLVQVKSLANRSHLPLLHLALAASNSIDFTQDISYSVLDTVYPRLTPQLLNSIPLKEQSLVIDAVLDHLQCEQQVSRDKTMATLVSIMTNTQCILAVLVRPKQPLPPMHRLLSLMEIIKVNATHIANSINLIAPLQNALKSLNADITDGPFDHATQMTLIALHSLVEALDTRDAANFAKLFDIDVVLAAITSRNDPQTANHALLLLSRVASLAPVKLFGSFPAIMRVIEETLRRDDNYTMGVLRQFLANTLPLFTSHGIAVASIFRVFLARISSLLPKARVPLFIGMLSALSFEKLDVLFTVMLEHKIQILRRANNSTPSSDDNEQESSSNEMNEFNSFMTAIADQVPAVQISECLARMTSSLNLISIETATVGESDSSNELSAIFEANSAKDNRLMQANVLDFVDERLGATAYLESLTFGVNAAERTAIENHYLSAFTSLLVLIRSTSEYVERSKSLKNSRDGKGRDKYLRKLLASVHRCMDRYNQLLSVDGFIVTVAQLMHHDDSSVRRRSLVILNEKISAVRSVLTQAHISKFLGLLEEMALVIANTSEPDANRQTALLSFEILARNFAAGNGPLFLAHMPTIIKAMGHGTHQVVSSALICIATLCAELQARTVPYIPQFFPVLLTTLTGSYKGDETGETRTLLQLSCISSLEMMLKKVSRFLSPYLPQLLNALLHPRLTNTGTNGTKVFNQVKKILGLLTRNIEFRLLLPALTSAYEFAVAAENDASLICLFDFVGDISDNLSPKDVALHHKAIFKFYLQCFELRHRHASKVRSIDTVETHIVTSFITLVMKLNENLFKPLFLKTIDWALQSPAVGNGSVKRHTSTSSREEAADQGFGDIDNTLFFYKLVNALSSHLKAIFVPYLGYFIDNSIHYLESIITLTPTSEANGSSNSNNKRKKALLTNGSSISASSKDSTQEELLCHIIGGLSKCMLYDKDGFLDKQKFEKLLPALVNQLDNQMGTSDAYHARIEKYLVPCITQMAITINQDMLWKPLNHAVLMKTRSPYANVRLSAISVVHSLHKHLGEQLLILLPETIPFISELLEDSVPEVEQACQTLVKTIENHLGVEESISSYL